MTRPVDIRRRFFLFGVAAVVATPNRTFHLLPEVPLFVPTPPTLVSIEMIMEMRRILDEQQTMTGISDLLRGDTTRWAYVAKPFYDAIVGEVTWGPSGPLPRGDAGVQGADKRRAS